MSAFGTLAALAAHNRGIVTRREARAAGVSDRDLRSLVHRGSIVRLARGVYQVGVTDIGDPRSITERHKLVLGLESAAAWYGVDLPRSLHTLVASAPRSRGQRRDGIKGVELHRSDVAGEVLVVRGVRVTTPLRTIIDIARIRPLEDAVAIADGFMRAHLVTYEELRAAAAAARGRGRGRLLLVAQLADPLAGSLLESLCRVLMWRHDLPTPTSQVTLTHRRTGWQGRVDFAWLRQHVVLECDGWEFHGTRDAFQTDRRRWSTMTRAGWRVVVVTWFDVTADPDYVIDLLRDVLGGDPDPDALQVHTLSPKESDSFAA